MTFHNISVALCQQKCAEVASKNNIKTKVYNILVQKW